MRLPAEPTALAPDGSEVRVLLGTFGGQLVHFELAAGRVSRPVTHRTIDEIWFIVSGTGEMWRKQGDREEVVELLGGLCLTIPLGTHFQFRASPDSSVAAVAVTLPPWPGDGEAVFVEGPWPHSTT
jgi:mannose-6-phosphate isomerase-like protein (cupin superfamily)